jgi:hypothetical protein
MMKITGMALVGVAMSSVCLGQVQTPEIDPASAANALALLTALY